MATYRMRDLAVDAAFVMWLGLAALGVLVTARGYLVRRQHRPHGNHYVDTGRRQ